MFSVFQVKWKSQDTLNPSTAHPEILRLQTVQGKRRTICRSAEIQGTLLPTFSLLDSVLYWIGEESTYLLNVALCIIPSSKEEWKGKKDLLLPESWSVFNVKQPGVLKTRKVVVMKRGTLSMHIRKYFYEKPFCLFACVGFFSVFKNFWNTLSRFLYLDGAM